MLINLRETSRLRITSDIVITEFFPYRDEKMSVVVPASKLGSGKAISCFQSLNRDGLSVEPNREIISLQDYKSTVNELLGHLSGLGISARLLESVDKLYDKYVFVSQHFTIYGVMSVEIARNVSVVSTPIKYIPADGLNILLGIESYMKSINLIFQNIAIDIFTYCNMYNTYKQSVTANSKPVENYYLLKAKNLNEVIEEIKQIMNSQGLTGEHVYNLIKSDELYNDKTINGYIQYMMSKYNLELSLSYGILPYIFESYTTTSYEKAGLTNYYKTTGVVIYASPNTVERYNNSSLNML